MKPLSVVVTTIFNIFGWFMIVFGIYIINHGHTTPGGGFQGGTIIATFLGFVLVAWGGKKFLAWVNDGMYGTLEILGLLMFFIVGCLGFPNSFFYNSLAIPTGGEAISAWLPYCGTIFYNNFAVGLEVAGALSLIIFYMYRSIHMVETGAGMGGERGHDRFDR